MPQKYLKCSKLRMEDLLWAVQLCFAGKRSSRTAERKWETTRGGRERDVRTPELVDKIRKFLDEDRRVSLPTVVLHGQMVNKEYYVEVLREFGKIFCRKRPELFRSGQWYLHQGNAPTQKSILVTSYLTEMEFKTVPHSPYSPDLAPCDFLMFPKLKENLRGCRFEDVEEMKEAVTETLDTFTLKEYERAFKKWLERYKCVEVLLGNPTLKNEGDKIFMFLWNT